MRSILLVGLGGAAGSICRYLIHLYFEKNQISHFPLATLTANVTGCFLVGIILGLFHKNHLITEELRLLLAIGFCGGLTTFSTFTSESFNLIGHKEFLIASLYISISVMTGLLAFWTGNLLIKN